MRIRKNAKLSSLQLGLSSSTPTAALQSHVCQLNQSPWDVITFSHDYPSPTSSFHLHHHRHRHQLEGADGFTGNATFSDSLGPLDGGVEMTMEDDDYDTGNWKRQEAPDGNNIDDGDNHNNANDTAYYREGKSNTGGGVPGGFGMMRGCCKRTNGKGWQCSREAKEGHYLCDHHSKSCNTDNNNSVSGAAFGPSTEPCPSPAKKGGTGRRGRPPKRGPSSKSSSEANNSNQFYYYSGFGPSWGRRRAQTQRGGSGSRGGGGGGRGESRIEAAEESSGRSSGTSPPAPSCRVGAGGEEEMELDYAVIYDIEEDEDEVEEGGINEEGSGGGGGRKRTRKPVKARSLKSLM